MNIRRLKPETAKAPHIASVPVPDTLAALHVNPETGLTYYVPLRLDRPYAWRRSVSSSVRTLRMEKAPLLDAT